MLCMLMSALCLLLGTGSLLLLLIAYRQQDEVSPREL